MQHVINDLIFMDPLTQLAHDSKNKSQIFDANIENSEKLEPKKEKISAEVEDILEKSQENVENDEILDEILAKMSSTTSSKIDWGDAEKIIRSKMPMNET